MGKIDLKGKRVLVTGGNGYLGKHLVTWLQKENAKVFVIDKIGVENNNSFIIDITNRQEVEDIVNEIQPEVIFHLAASLNRNRDFDQYDNINNINHFGTLNLLLALKEIPYLNFIFTSTSEIYGDNIAPFHEGQIPFPVSPYSLTKVHSENLVSTFSKTYNKNFTILRLFNFFGKNMPLEFFIPQMITSLKKESFFEMTFGEQKRDFLYVDDIIQAMILSATKREAYNETFNVCSGTSSTLKQLVIEIKNELKSSCEIKFGAIPYRKKEIWNMVGDNTKIKNILGFKVKYDLRAGIVKILEEKIKVNNT